MNFGKDLTCYAFYCIKNKEFRQELYFDAKASSVKCIYP
jgi:hypothetical protein